MSSNHSQACTSITSAQIITTSSIISFDIYGTYINKNATDKQLIRWSHIGFVSTSIAISTLATAFHLGGVNMSWLLYALGNIVNPGVIPTCFALLWKGQIRAAAITAPNFGMICSISVWLSTAYYYFGKVTITSTGATMLNLFGCVTAFVVPLPITLIISLTKPKAFDSTVFNRI
jgi:Na+/proline symporter